jgi:hypothetical protein
VLIAFVSIMYPDLGFLTVSVVACGRHYFPEPDPAWDIDHAAARGFVSESMKTARRPQWWQDYIPPCGDDPDGAF